MGQHGSARLSVHSRLTIAHRVMEEGWTVAAAAQAANVSRQTASKWVGRYRELGEVGLRDASTRPHTIRRRRCRLAVVRRIRRLRAQRLGSHRIAWMLGLARSTVYRVLRRLGLGRLPRLEPRPEPNRDQWPAPGDLLHLDTKRFSDGWARAPGGATTGPERPPYAARLDRGARRRRSSTPGWPTSRSSPDEQPDTTVAFFRRALAFYAGQGIAVHRVMTDNGNPLPL